MKHVAILVAALLVFGLAGARAARAQDLPGPNWLAADAPRSTPLTREQGLADLHAPAQGRAFRFVAEHNGFVEVMVSPGGEASLRTSWRPFPLALQPGDLAAFDAALARSESNAMDLGDRMFGCLDNCVETILEIEAGGRYWYAGTAGFYPSRPGVNEAVIELLELANARTLHRRATPGGWWTAEGAPRPAPSFAGPTCRLDDMACRRTGWATLLQGLQLTDLTADRGVAYRLLLFAHEGRPTVITMTGSYDPRREPCGRLYVCVGWGDPLPLNRVVVRTTGRWPARDISIERLVDIEQMLANAQFATLAAEPAPGQCPGSACAAGACPGPPVWVLEAVIEGRYRYVTGGACDRRGLEAALIEMTRAGGAHAWP